MGLQNISNLLDPFLPQESVLLNSLGEDFVLCENGNIVFHWADYFETCNLVASRLEKDSALFQDFLKCENALKRLNLIPVWIKTQKKIHQTTMYFLYEEFILNQSELPKNLDPHLPLDISFISGTGPFKQLAITDCFNTLTYRDFVIFYLLKDKLPKRDYRIFLKSKILFEYGPNFSQAELISLEQLTTRGMLLSVSSEFYMANISKLDLVRILINFSTLHEGANKSINELRKILSQFTFNLFYTSMKEDCLNCNISDFKVQTAFDFGRSKKVFLFISYDKLAELNPLGIHSILTFVNHTKDLIREYYQEKNKNKKLA
jgi:hypothetical protein